MAVPLDGDGRDDGEEREATVREEADDVRTPAGHIAQPLRVGCGQSANTNADRWSRSPQPDVQRTLQLSQVPATADDEAQGADRCPWSKCFHCSPLASLRAGRPAGAALGRVDAGNREELVEKSPNRPMSPISASSVAAIAGPTPGIVCSRHPV